MAKVITSPVEGFPGTITLADPLTLAQCHEVELSFGDPNYSPNGKKVWLTTVDELALKALIVCSERWDIQGQPEKPTLDTFVATPRGASHKLLAWAFQELAAIYFGEFEVPNA